ncbi:MAG: hypothetical protein ACFE85_18900 [Candidatus Hodarchaeota archaeon]
MDIINYLGDILAENINVSQPIARGLVKLAIKDELGPFTSFAHLNYKNLNIIIKNSLKERLIKLEIASIDNLINLLLSELNKNQSLITMGSI